MEIPGTVEGKNGWISACFMIKKGLRKTCEKITLKKQINIFW